MIEYQRAIIDHREVLTNSLECQYGLTDQLLSKRVLTRQQLSVVEAQRKNRFKQNAALLEMLSHVTDVKRYEDFLDALRATHQSHLANYIVAGGGNKRNCDHFFVVLYNGGP